MNTFLLKEASGNPVLKNIGKGLGIGAAAAGGASLLANAIGGTVGEMQGGESDSYKGRRFITDEEKAQLSKHRYPQRDAHAEDTLLRTYRKRNPGTGKRIWGALSGKRALYAGRGRGVSERMDVGSDRANRMTHRELQDIKSELALQRLRENR